MPVLTRVSVSRGVMAVSSFKETWGVEYFQVPQSNSQRGKHNAPEESTFPSTSYISEEQYRRNQERIRENRFGKKSKGAARSGQSLLAGIVYCGKCGRRMTNTPQ